MKAGREAAPRCVWDNPSVLIHYLVDTVVASLPPFLLFFPFPPLSSCLLLSPHLRFPFLCSLFAALCAAGSCFGTT